MYMQARTDRHFQPATQVAGRVGQSKQPIDMKIRAGRGGGLGMTCDDL